MRGALMQAAFKGVRLSGNIYTALKFTQPPLHIGLHAQRFCNPKPLVCTGTAPAVAAARHKPETSHVSQKLLLTLFIYICRIMPCQT
tara:strand:- start:111012 stop:111272 length:261 start_codon:yes stop_codon:yes gene_type:complete